MGCHTWFYVHIPERKNNWNKEFLEKYIKQSNEILNNDDCTTEEKSIWKEYGELARKTKPNKAPKLAKKILENTEGVWNYGLYLVRHNKIYRDTCTELDKSHNYFDTTYIAQFPFHDTFRIYDYNAKPCYSLRQTLRRCKKYKVDWNLKSSSGYLINNLDAIKDFWNLYPDGIIIFWLI